MMKAIKKFLVAAGVAAAGLCGSAQQAGAQVVYSPYTGYNFGYPYGYGSPSFSYSVTNPNGASVNYSYTGVPGIYGAYGLGYRSYSVTSPYISPYAWRNPAFGPGAYSYNYPGVFYTPGSYRFYRY
jgi:hypothetical protein